MRTVRREKGLWWQLPGQEFPLHLHVLDITQVVVLHSPTATSEVLSSIQRFWDVTCLCWLTFIWGLGSRGILLLICSFTEPGTKYTCGCTKASKSDWSYSLSKLPCSLRHRCTIPWIGQLFFSFKPCLQSSLSLFSVCWNSSCDSWEIRRFHSPNPELRSDEIWNFYRFFILVWFPQLISNHLQGAWDKLSQCPEPLDRCHVPFQV